MIRESDPLWRAMDLLGRTWLSDAEELELEELLKEYRLDDEPTPIAQVAMVQAAAA